MRAYSHYEIPKAKVKIDTQRTVGKQYVRIEVQGVHSNRIIIDLPDCVEVELRDM